MESALDYQNFRGWVDYHKLPHFSPRGDPRKAILVGITADQLKRSRTKMAAKELATEQKEKKPSLEHFSLGDGSDSSLVSLTKEPNFRRKQAMP